MNEIKLYENMAAQNALEAIEKLGQIFSRSGMIGVDSPAQGEVVALSCMVEGINPLQFKAKYDVIQGNPSIRSQWMLAEYKRRGGKITWLDDGEDGKEAKATFDYDGQSITRTYTLEQAKKAKLIKPGGAYEKDPGAMLRARLVSRTIKMIAPEILEGNMTDIDAIDSIDDGRASGGEDAFTETKVVEEKPVEKEAKVSKKTKPAAKKTEAPKEKKPKEEPVKTIDATATVEEVAEPGPDQGFGKYSEADAIAYVQHLGWIGANQGLADLKADKKELVENKREALVRSLGKWMEKKNG